MVLNRRLPNAVFCTLAFAAIVAGQSADPQALLQQGLQSYQQRDFDTALDVWLKGLALAKEHGVLQLWDPDDGVSGRG